LLLRSDEAGKDCLKLVEHVLGWLLVVVVRVLDGKDVISHAGDHEELLEEGDHIADAAQVLEADVARGGLLVVQMSDGPVGPLVRSPRCTAAELGDVVKDESQVAKAVPHEHWKQTKASCPGGVAASFNFLSVIRRSWRFWHLKKAPLQEVRYELAPDLCFALRILLEQDAQETHHTSDSAKSSVFIPARSI
jgi:hypothetical protein